MPKCRKCDDTGVIVYTKPAPSPPYPPGVFLDYGIICSHDDKQHEDPNYV